MAALGKHTNVKVFSEKLLLLLNRGGEAQGCARRHAHVPGPRVLGPPDPSKSPGRLWAQH